VSSKVVLRISGAKQMRRINTKRPNYVVERTEEKTWLDGENKNGKRKNKRILRGG
jgi:hypothetical protein